MHILKQIGKLIIAGILIAGSTITNASPVPSIQQQITHASNMAFLQHKAGGVVLVRKGEKIIYRKAFGLADLENQVKMKPEMVFKIASNTKQFTAVAIMQLVEMEKLSFDRRIGDVLKNYPVVGSDITVQQLLTHTSGIKNISRIDVARKARPKDATIDEMISFFSHLPLDFEPGSRWSYSNSNYILLTKMIEKVSGVSYADYMQTHIFKPLGMANTLYGSRFSLIANQARGYQKTNGKVQNADFISMTHSLGAGGLMSNDLDLSF